jgi:hypothetical protein
MAKANKETGATMTPTEYDNAEYVSPRVRRTEVGTVTKRRKKDTGGAKSVGGNSIPDTNPPVESGNAETNSDPQTVPVTENPSSPEEEEHSTVDSADGTAQTTNRSGRKAPAKKATPASKRAGVRSTDDMDLTF